MLKKAWIFTLMTLLSLSVFPFTTNDAVHVNDPSISMWVSSYTNYTPGTNTNMDWQQPLQSIGVADTTRTNVVSLGDSGSIELYFPLPIHNGPGWDFAVFENGFLGSPFEPDLFFLELAFVEVSVDGLHYERFPAQSLTPDPVFSYEVNMNPSNLYNLAGKYPAGWGTPFDLETLGLDQVKSIRLVDVVGDGTVTDSVGRVIYDPYPTEGSGGFDLDAIAVRYPATTLHIHASNEYPVIEWLGVSNTCYTLEWSSDLNSGIWSNLVQVCATNIYPITITDTNAPSHRIYRLEVH